MARSRTDKSKKSKLPARFSTLLATMKAPGEVAQAVPYHSFRMAGESEAIIEINGFIGGDFDYWTWEETGKSSATLASEIKAAGTVKTLRVLLNSSGGNALEGSQMNVVFKAAIAKGVEVIFEVGAACMSAATLVVCAGSKILTAANSLWMFHNPSTYAYGEAKDLRAEADALDVLKASVMTIYQDRNPGMGADAISAMLDATTWLTGAEAVAAGWADALLETPAADAVMALDFAELNLDTASDEVKARLEVLKASMSAGSETEVTESVAEPTAEPVVDPEVAALREQLDLVSATLAAISDRLPVQTVDADPVVETAPDPVVTVDLNHPIVRAVQSLAKGDGRFEEFSVAVAAGASVADLRARFLQPRAVSEEVTTTSNPASPHLAQATNKLPEPSAVYASFNAPTQAKE